MSDATIDEPAAAFWEACARGHLEAQRCVSCGHLRFPPAPICPECLSPEARWERLSGRGSVLSYVVFQRAYNKGWTDRVPYNVSLIELDEGVRMFSNVEGDAPDAVEVGMPVEVEFIERDGAIVPVFRPTA